MSNTPEFDLSSIRKQLDKIEHEVFQQKLSDLERHTSTMGKFYEIANKLSKLEDYLIRNLPQKVNSSQPSWKEEDFIKLLMNLHLHEQPSSSPNLAQLRQEVQSLRQNIESQSEAAKQQRADTDEGLRQLSKGPSLPQQLNELRSQIAELNGEVASLKLQVAKLTDEKQE